MKAGENKQIILDVTITDGTADVIRTLTIDVEGRDDVTPSQHLLNNAQVLYNNVETTKTSFDNSIINNLGEYGLVGWLLGW